MVGNLHDDLNWDLRVTPRPGVGKVTMHHSADSLKDAEALARRLVEDRKDRAERRQWTVICIWDELSRMVELDRGLTSSRTKEMLMSALRRHDGDTP